MTTENLRDYAAHDGVAPDRWASALHLFDNGVGVPREESVLERWERARLLFGAKDYIGAARLLAGIVEEVPEQPFGAKDYIGAARLLAGIVEEVPEQPSPGPA